MRHIGIAVFAVMAGSSLFAQTPNAPEQSPRQALIEMFMGKGPNDFTKHLPEGARTVLLHKGETPENSVLLKVASAIRGIDQSGEKVETFDDGPNILVTENTNIHERVEVAVEHESSSGGDSEIELSVHIFKNDEPEPLPVVPQLIFTLKQEDEIWRVTELTLAAHVPLEDTDYLKGLRKQQDEANESAAQMRVSMIMANETAYAASHIDVGYVCKLESLYPSPDGMPNVNNPFGSDEFSGYRISLSGCEGKPAKSYRLTVSPIDPDSEMKTFCVDESGTIKSAEAADSSTCLTDGKIINAPAPTMVEPKTTIEPEPTD